MSAQWQNAAIARTVPTPEGTTEDATPASQLLSHTILNVPLRRYHVNIRHSDIVALGCPNTVKRTYWEHDFADTILSPLQPYSMII